MGGSPFSPKSVVLVCLELLLGVTFVLDFVRGVYYMRRTLRFTHMIFPNFILTLLTVLKGKIAKKNTSFFVHCMFLPQPPTLAILFEIWYFEHPAELLVPVNPSPTTEGGSNATYVPRRALSGQERVNAVYVMSATPTQALVDVLLIFGMFSGDRSSCLANQLFAFLGGGIGHLAIGAIFLSEVSDPRYAHRRARTALGAAVALLCGASHLLAAVMFAVMREEPTSHRSAAATAAAASAGTEVTPEEEEEGGDREGGDGADKLGRSSSGIVGVIKPSAITGKKGIGRTRRDREPTMHMGFEQATYVPIYRRWYRNKAIEDVPARTAAATNAKKFK